MTGIGLNKDLRAKVLGKLALAIHEVGEEEVRGLLKDAEIMLCKRKRFLEENFDKFMDCSCSEKPVWIILETLRFQKDELINKMLLTWLEERPEETIADLLQTRVLDFSHSTRKQ